MTRISISAATACVASALLAKELAQLQQQQHDWWLCQKQQYMQQLRQQVQIQQAEDLATTVAKAVAVVLLEVA